MNLFNLFLDDCKSIIQRTLWFYLSLITIVYGDVVSTSGQINFRSNENSQTEMILTGNGLTIGSNASSSSNLYVSGNSIISTKLMIGSTNASHSTLQISGTIAYEIQSISDNTTLGDNSLVFINTSDGDIQLSLPDPQNITGRVYDIHKTQENNEVTFNAGYDVTLTSGNNGRAKIISLGSSWYILETEHSNLTWSPTSLNTSLWLDASDVNTLTKGGSGNISQWNDKSGNDNHATQSTASLQPIYDASGWQQNSTPTVEFDGSDDGFNLVSTVATDRDIYIVEMGRGYLFSSSDQRIIPQHTNNGLYWNTSPNLTNVDSSSWRSATSEQLSLFSLNNSGDYTIATSGSDNLTGSGSAAANNLDRIGLKWDSGTSVPTWSGNISEIIITNEVLNTDDRQKVEGYLAHKWGLEDQLPVSHPYKSTAP